MKIQTWDNCYDQQWASMITPASMAHPAKMARGLLERIIRHGFERGYWSKGDTIGDCFGGVGTTGIIGAYHGLRVVSCELEKKFISLARRNFALHTSKWKRLGCPRPVMLQGDSRKFDQIVGPVVGMVSSPPWHQGTSGHDEAFDTTAKHVASRKNAGPVAKEYGDSPGQIGQLPSGELAAVLSSPPYADQQNTPKCTRYSNRSDALPDGCGGLAKASGNQSDYGQTSGQIGRLKGGELRAVCTSPPYDEGLGHGGVNNPMAAEKGLHAALQNNGYGGKPENIGNGCGETYWQAVRDVYLACHRAIAPGGTLVLVTKDYVKQRKRVPLSDDTITLCESIGFTLIERVQAMLVSENRHGDLFGGEDVKKKSRKSFFRRLAESKGSPEINHEDVLIFRR